MGGIDGPERKGTSRQVAFDDDHRDSPAPARAPAAAPWNADFERVVGRSQPYDQALFSGSVTFIGPRTLLAAHPAADSAWDAVKNAPMPRLSGISTPSCTPLFAVLDNARTFADRGIPVAQALQHSLLTSVGDLERFLDEYIAYTAARPEMKGLHDDALRTAPAIFAKRLDTEAAEQRQATEEARMHDRLALLQSRAPLPVQQRAVVGKIAIPIARVVIDKAKAVPIVGELVTAAEVATGKDLGGLGEDLDRSERLLSGALLLAPFALEALGTGVRGAAQLSRLASAAGRSTEETRGVLRAAITLTENEAALREAFAAQKAGRALTVEQTTALRSAEGALREIRGAAAQSRLDVRASSGLRSFAPNANAAIRSPEEAAAIALRQGVQIPSWIRIEVDPSIREAASFAEYRLGSVAVRATSMAAWSELAPTGIVVVRIHPSVLKSDEKIVGVLQHEVWELTELRGRVERGGLLPAEEVQRLIDGTGAKNLHGQAWDVADLRVLIMREPDPVKKAQLTERLTGLMARYRMENRK